MCGGRNVIFCLPLAFIDLFKLLFFYDLLVFVKVSRIFEIFFNELEQYRKTNAKSIEILL